MKRDPAIRDAIDKSLYGVRFNQNDMRSVLRAVRRDDAQPELAPRRRKKPRGWRLELAFCTLLAVAVIAPMSYLALHTAGTPHADVIAAQGSVSPMVSATGHSAAATPDASVRIDERAAIAIARERFEALCDTSIFTFEEYAITAALSEDGAPVYTVTMESLYGNGCLFVVTIDAVTGEVLSTSSPSAAVIPTGLTRDNPSIGAWYDEYGAYRFTWPLEQQAEFSRRYEGYLVRTPQASNAEDDASEATPEQAIELAREAMVRYESGVDADALTYYAVLRSERAYADHVARYEVYAFEQPVTDALPEGGYLITLRADTLYGTVPSETAIDRDEIEAREDDAYQ